jgi:hypothetical protein
MIRNDVKFISKSFYQKNGRLLNYFKHTQCAIYHLLRIFQNKSRNFFSIFSPQKINFHSIDFVIRNF